MKENILVAGANGTTGKIIVDLLKSSENYNPIAMVRKESQINQFKNRNIKTVVADLEGNVDHAVVDAHKIIFAAGSGGKKVESVDRDGAKKLIDAGKKANIKKFVMLSSMGADNPSSSSELKDYLKAKNEADNYLKNSGLNYSIVRPGTLNNDDETGKISINEHLNKSGEISRADVAKTLLASLSDSARQNETFEILKGNVHIAEAIG